MLRQPAVAGRFYPADAVQLKRQIVELTPATTKKRRAIACMVPHAGYVYSGHVAGAVYGAIELPSRILLIGPRHFPGGKDMALLSAGAWQTPLGIAQIDSALAGALARACPLLVEDDVAHAREHSLEVQVPFLQALAPDFRFVPIVLGRTRLGELEQLGAAIAKVIAVEDEPVLIVASSDMNHYESDAVTRVKDRKAIEKLLTLDARGLHETVAREEISMCGYAAATTTLFAAHALGAKQAEEIRYATSGDITGDKDAVVGYCGIVIF
ncbi:MAG: AmmeMemoRadiSam system protein B [Acidobacteria bacterium]|nr:AmmeMemoRadiSam system protein B [Acidobacteriota bacterium]